MSKAAVRDEGRPDVISTGFLCARTERFYVGLRARTERFYVGLRARALGRETCRVRLCRILVSVSVLAGDSTVPGALPQRA